jgi:dimethylhistidine N-methyltransferase
MSECSFFEDYKPEHGNFRDDTICGLQANPKTMKPKYLYDKKGAKLFEDICETEEYYITRTEIALLDEIGDELASLAGENVRLVEFGMGAGDKARKLLSVLQDPYGFVGIDISHNQLQNEITSMAKDFPTLEVGGICADFFTLKALPEPSSPIYNLGFFPGSTIGNFLPAQQKDLLISMKTALGNKASLIIGVDLQKNKDVLHAAYDDKAGASAAFSINLLERIKRELHADIDVDAFKHEATYKPDDARIQICLRSLKEQSIQIGEEAFLIRKGEPIYTENSYKFTPAQFQTLAREAGWQPKKFWCDDDNLFSIHWLDSTE